MKKERIAGLCICVVLWGSLQSVCSVAAGMKQFGASRYCWSEANGRNVRSDLLAALACGAWPPLGVFYGEMHLLKMKSRELPADDAADRAAKPVFHQTATIGTGAKAARVSRSAPLPDSSK